MARPKKQEVDYFPHYCDHGKVLFILESRWGNDGYAVFYKLTEVLSKTTGHCYDCSDVESWEYLVSRMGTSEERVGEILNKLASMGVIDGDLWNEKRIWMQSFVDSICDAYSRRKVDLPQKPELMHAETHVSGINEGINPQSKLNKSKVKESKYTCDVPPLENPATDNHEHKPERNQDPYWDSLVVVFGKPDTEGSKKLYGKVRRSIKATGCDPTEIIIRANRLRAAWGDSALTINSLETHWPKFAHDVKPLNGSRASPAGGLKFDRDAAIRDMAMDIAQKEDSTQ